MQLIPLELIRNSRDSVRKAREAYLIDKAKTLEPLGFNCNRRGELTRQTLHQSYLLFLFLISLFQITQLYNVFYSCNHL